MSTLSPHFGKVAFIVLCCCCCCCCCCCYVQTNHVQVVGNNNQQGSCEQNAVNEFINNVTLSVHVSPLCKFYAKPVLCWTESTILTTVYFTYEIFIH